MTSAQDRLVISRLVHRFGFGPKPGQYQSLLAQGVVKARASVLNVPSSDAGLASVPDPAITDLGPYPSDPTARTAYERAISQQYQTMTFWWLDRMVLAESPLVERMTWFWHGHWATAISKVEYSLPMKIQNETLRAHALGNFADMSRAMVLDGALIYWLDGQLNIARAPNENLGREFMELFVLGVGNYNEFDVKAAAQALTGYQVVPNNGAVTFQAAQHNHWPISILDTRDQFDAPSLSDYLVWLDANAHFITQRLWFRLVSSSAPAPRTMVKNFATRNIASLVHAIARDPAMSNPVHSQAKSPVEWFVSACRALGIRPSTLPSPSTVTYFLGQLGQVPFNPPSVGGWPFDEAWLTAASTQTRLSLAQYLIQHGNVSPITATTGNPLQACADWLGVPQWSARTSAALALATSDPQRLALLALCAPEFIVSA